MSISLSLPLLLSHLPSEATADGASLRALLTAAASGDSDALARIYDAVAEELYGLALWHGRDRELAEDAVQEVFCGLAGGRVRLPEKLTSPRAWLLRCVRNATIDLQRRSPRQASLETAQCELVLARGQHAERSAEIAALSSAVAALAPRLRAAVYLHAYAGMTFREAGAVLGVPTFTAASRYRLALRRLEKLLGA